MRFAVTAILLIVAVFGFFLGYGVSSFLLGTFYNALEPHASLLSSTNAKDDMLLISSGFGIICAIAIVMIIVVFVLDSLSDEPENYWRE